MAKQSKTLQRRKAHALGHWSAERHAPGPVLSALALRAVKGGEDHANLIPPSTTPDPPPIYRG
jgi:hypothetical protein